LEKSTSYEVPHYAVFSKLPALHFSLVETEMERWEVYIIPQNYNISHCMQDSRINPEKVYYCSIKTILSFRLIAGNIKIKIDEL
jgi:hypothetical protein